MNNDIFEYTNIDLDNPDEIVHFSSNSISLLGNDIPKKTKSKPNTAKSADVSDNFTDIDASNAPDNLANTNNNDEEYGYDFASLYDETPSQKASKKVKHLIREICSYILLLGLAFIIAYAIDSFIILNASIPTGSMFPTISVGDRLFGNRLSYKTDTPQRGDIIMFYCPDNTSETYIKRVIGIPDDIIQIIDGTVYVNGNVLNESSYLLDSDTGEYLNEKPVGNFGPYIVPKDSYFVMGDNRNDSWDSRYWTNTFVPKSLILAKAICRYYPHPQILK